MRLSPDSHLVSSPYLIAVNVDAGEKTEGFIHLAAPVTEDAHPERMRGPTSKPIRSVEWDRKEDRIAAAEEERLGTLLLATRPFTPADEEAAPILCDVVRATPGLLTFSNEAKQLQARTGLMKKVFSEETWPDLSDEHLLAGPKNGFFPGSEIFAVRRDFGG